MSFHLFSQTCILASSILGAQIKSKTILKIKKGPPFLSFYQRVKTMQNSFLIWIRPPGSISSFIYNQSEFGACKWWLGVWRREAVLLQAGPGWAGQRGTGAPHIQQGGDADRQSGGGTAKTTQPWRDPAALSGRTVLSYVCQVSIIGSTSAAPPDRPLLRSPPGSANYPGDVSLLSAQLAR